MNTPRSLVDSILTIPADQLRRHLEERHLGCLLMRPEITYTTTSAIPPVTRNPGPPSVDMARLLNRRDDRRDFDAIQMKAAYSFKVAHFKPTIRVEVDRELDEAGLAGASRAAAAHWVNEVTEKCRAAQDSLLGCPSETSSLSAQELIEVGLLIANAFEQRGQPEKAAELRAEVEALQARQAV